MKKYLNYAFAGAIALTGAVGFASCSGSSGEDVVVVNNPDYNSETNSVKTEFAISLPSYVGASTRQTDDVTQAQETPTFRGMQDMVLIPFNATVTGASTPWKGKTYPLESITGWDLANQKAKVYKTLDIPINTKVFMFYGQATVPGSTVNDNFSNGVLNKTSFTGAVSSYTFSLQPINATYNSTSDTKGNAIVDYIQGIRGNETTNAFLSSTALISLLTNFKPTAASSASIQAAVEKLWKSVNVEAYTQTEKDIIKARIEGTSNAYATISENVVTLTANTNLTGYPENLFFPDGAVTITWDGSTPTLNASGGLNVSNLQNYVYPAALYYRANSTIGVSNTENVSTTFGSDTWSAIAASNKYTWTGDDAKVGPNTRSVAMKDQIQYAVGRLDLSVKAANATLYDANGLNITVNDNGFPISAVFVGGQKDVGYDFTPNGATAYTIYDKTMNGTVAAKAGTTVGVNHTLVLETATDIKTVNVAVEMTNNTNTVFRGKDGDVPINGKFYLIGTLDLDKSAEYTGGRTKIFEQDFITTATFTISQGQPASELGDNKNTVGLGAAYNVLPDLGTSNLEVAFSVDLTWQSGLSFTVGM